MANSRILGLLLTYPPEVHVTTCPLVKPNVKTWDRGSRVRDQICTGVREICASAAAFAAVKEDGSVATWGHRNYGGDSRTVRERLSSGAAWKQKVDGVSEKTFKQGHLEQMIQFLDRF